MALKTGICSYQLQAEIELDDIETGKPGDYYVTLMGPTHPDRKQIEQRNADASGFKVGRKGTIDTVMSSAERERRRLDRLVACTVAWRNVDGPDNAPMQCTPDNVRRVYVGYPAIADQVEAALADHANFFTSRPTNS